MVCMKDGKVNVFFSNFVGFFIGWVEGSALAYDRLFVFLVIDIL